MKLSDLLDTRPFNALTCALGVFLLTSIMYAPGALEGNWHSIFSKLNEAVIDSSLESLRWDNSLETITLIDYSAMQTAPVQPEYAFR